MKVRMCVNNQTFNNVPYGLRKGRKSLEGSAGKNSFYCIFARKKRKNAGAGERGTWPPLVRPPSATRVVRCSIPRCSAKPGGGRRAAAAKEVCCPFFHAASSAAARSADACGFSRIGCSIPRCTRSDSGAGGGR